MQRVCWFCVGMLLLAGCANRPTTPESTPAAAGPNDSVPASAMIITPAQSTGGRVALANMSARYVVVTFPLGTQPQADQKLSLYRDGLKVGEVRVTNLQRDNNTIADILAGEARVGDEVR